MVMHPQQIQQEEIGRWAVVIVYLACISPLDLPNRTVSEE